MKCSRIVRAFALAILSYDKGKEDVNLFFKGTEKQTLI